MRYPNNFISELCKAQRLTSTSNEKGERRDKGRKKGMKNDRAIVKYRVGDTVDQESLSFYFYRAVNFVIYGKRFAFEYL